MSDKKKTKKQEIEAEIRRLKAKMRGLDDRLTFAKKKREARYKEGTRRILSSLKWKNEVDDLRAVLSREQSNLKHQEQKLKKEKRKIEE